MAFEDLLLHLDSYPEATPVKDIDQAVAFATAVGGKLTALAQECVTNGYERLEWSVLNWNTPAIDFYKSLGAGPQDEWMVYRLTDAALAQLGS